MGERERRNEEIERYIVDHLRGHEQQITGLVTQRFGISRQAAARHLHRLEGRGVIAGSGKTRGHRYEFVLQDKLHAVYPIGADLHEDSVWHQDVAPVLAGVTDNVLTICQYGFTEMFNNALEHSEGRAIRVDVERWPDAVTFVISDDGVGIFNKIQRELGLDDPLHALLELSKGNLSTDPRHHTGQEIFFTVRAFDDFELRSGQLRFARRRGRFDYDVTTEQVAGGTTVRLAIGPNSNRTLAEVFDAFCTSRDGVAFDRTVVPVFLAQYGSEKLVSRSRARRLLARVDRFREVVLDFDQVDFMGQAFADEIFRVFQAEHPEVRLVWRNDNEEIAKMIRRAARSVSL